MKAWTNAKLAGQMEHYMEHNAEPSGVANLDRRQSHVADREEEEFREAIRGHLSRLERRLKDHQYEIQRIPGFWRITCSVAFGIWVALLVGLIIAAIADLAILRLLASG